MSVDWSCWKLSLLPGLVRARQLAGGVDLVVVRSVHYRHHETGSCYCWKHGDSTTRVCRHYCCCCCSRTADADCDSAARGRTTARALRFAPERLLCALIRRQIDCRALARGYTDGIAQVSDEVWIQSEKEPGAFVVVRPPVEACSSGKRTACQAQPLLLLAVCCFRRSIRIRQARATITYSCTFQGTRYLHGVPLGWTFGHEVWRAAVADPAGIADASEVGHDIREE